MSLSKATDSWKKISYLLLAAVLIGCGAVGYYYGAAFLKDKEIVVLDQKIQQKQEEINKYYAQTGFNEFLAIKELENSRSHLPWSDYINKILDILEVVKNVEDERDMVILSDFRVNLQELSLNGVVGNLKILYSEGAEGEHSLLSIFKELSFLKDITIRKYSKSSDVNGYAFSLSAKVVNDAGTTKSTTDQ